MSKLEAVKHEDPIGLHTQIVEVTPALAAEWLKRNKNNRPLNPTNLLQLTQEMKAGSWHLTHQAIAFDEDGSLLDGQHRLLAIVQSGATVRLLVAFDAERSSFACLDSGRRRTTADAIAIRGIENAKCVAAMARCCLLGIGGVNPTRALIDRLCVVHHDALQRFVPVSRAYSSPVGAAFTKAAIAHVRGVDDAAQRIIDFRFYGEADPMAALGKKLREIKGSGYVAQTTKYALTVSALRAVHEERPLTRLYKTTQDFELELELPDAQLELRGQP